MLLNKVQAEAVKNPYGPHMVIAGPGTGKTQLLGARIAEMLTSLVQIGPETILALTFTDAGCVAMRQRLIDFIGTMAYKVNIYTFHSFCNEIIQSNLDYFNARDIDPVNDVEVYMIIKNIIDELPNDHPLQRLKGDKYYEIPRLRHLFQLMKNENWSPEYFEKKTKAYLDSLPDREKYQYQRGNKKKGIVVGDPKTKLINEQKDRMAKAVAGAHLLHRYNTKLRESNRYDFADMISWVIEAFLSDDDFLFNYQERYQYVLVDEFQDTNGTQLALLRHLLDFWDEPNIFVVGDDDQALYEFNGARIMNMIDFYKEYKPKLYMLDMNYRSPQDLLDRAGGLIGNNKDRMINHWEADLTKDLVSMTPNKDAEGTISVVEYNNTLEERFAVIQAIHDLLEQKIDPGRIGVIYRKHRQGEDIIRQLINLDVPINVIRRTNVLNEVIVQQLITVLTFLYEHSEKPYSANHLMIKILHYKFNQQSIKDIETMLLGGENIYTQDNMASAKAVFYTELVGEMENMTLIQYLEYIINETGMLNWIYDQPHHRQLLLYLTTFFDFVKDMIFKYPDYNLGSLLESIDLMKQRKIALPALNLNFDESGVNFMTCHGAKGLEFDYIFMVGCTRNEWEKSRGQANQFALPDTLTYAKDDNTLESNRRLFYVSMTRAREKLHISYATKDEQNRDLERTQYIDEAGLVPHKSQVKIDVKERLFVGLIRPKMQFNPKADEQQIRNSLEFYRISISAVNKYMRCPVSFYYENILRTPFVASPDLIFGNCIHAALKSWYDEYSRTKKMPLFKSFYEVFLGELNHNYGQLGKKEYDSRAYLGKKLLGRYYKEHMFGSNNVTLNEFKFKKIVLPNTVPFTGDIDKMEFDGNLVDVVDYKTGKLNHIKSELRPANPDTEFLGGDYWRQIISYKIMINNFAIKPWKVRNTRIEVIDQQFMGPINVETSYKDEQIVLQQIKTAYDGIMALNFSQGCGECAWCEINNE